MATKAVTHEQAQQALDAYEQAGGQKRAAARILGLPWGTYSNRLGAAERYGMRPGGAGAATNPTEGAPFQHDAARLRVSALERELRDIKEHNKRLSEQVLSTESVRRLIHECDYPPSPPKWLTKKSPSTITGVPCLIASDWHADEVVNPLEINGVNAFNRQILDRRVKQLFEKTVELCIQHMANPKYDYCALMLGGDMVSGNIHEELRQSNCAPVTVTIMHVADLLIAGIDMLLAAFGKVSLYCVVGNHGRIDLKPRYKLRAFESYEWLLYQFLARHYKGDDRVHFTIADGPDLPFSVYSTRYLLTHGDQFRGGSGISGALAPLLLGDHRKRKRAMAMRQEYDVMVMGHWHQYIHLRGLIVNSSLKGYDEYAFANNYDFELPCQAMWITHPEHGITARWPIFLERPGTSFV